jgi:hypothetical protein
MTSPARAPIGPAGRAAVSAPSRRASANGTKWRLRSLVAMGHDATRIARALGIAPRTARRIITGDIATVAPGLAGLARELWDAWWDKRPPENTPVRRRAAATARRQARYNGWCTPAALNEDLLDQPGYRPYSIWRSAAGTGTADAFGPPAGHAAEPPSEPGQFARPAGEHGRVAGTSPAEGRRSA